MLVLLHFVVLFLLVILGFYIFVADPRSRGHQTFAGFIAFLALWTVKDLVFWNFPEFSSSAGWWASASFIIAIFMQYALVVFAWVFPENSRTPRKKLAVVVAPGLILVPAALLGLLWDRIDTTAGFNIELAPLAYVFGVYVYIVFLYGGYILIQKHRTYRDTQRGLQLGSILWGLTITVILITTVNVILPLVGVFDLLPFSSLFVLPGALIYAYAISNFKLFSLQSALDQFRLFPIAYKIALSIASVAIVSFVIFQIPIVWWAFANGMTPDAWKKYLVFSVLSALVPNLLLLLLIARTISRPLQRITVAAVEVSNGAYGTEVDLRRSNDEIGLLANSFNEMSRKMAADIDQLKHLNEHLVRSDRLAAMGTLAAGVAHEVNNPLASISSLIQMMRSEQISETEAKENLALISAQIGRISRVTKDLTEFARVRPAARTTISVNELIQRALRLALFDRTFQSLTVAFQPTEEDPTILADGDQLHQVLLNLFLNARDAMPDGGTLNISCNVEPGEVHISVADSGTGMDKLAMKKAFDPFFTTKAPGKGTGLGLAVCYAIVTAHDGTIDITDSDTGGTEFIIKLPRFKK